jgi:bacillithiol system protein YtxJ
MERMTRDVALIVVQQSRDVSGEVEKRTGVRHETPQIIIVRNGEAVWDASHWAIKSDAVESAFLANE